MPSTSNNKYQTVGSSLSCSFPDKLAGRPSPVLRMIDERTVAPFRGKENISFEDIEEYYSKIDLRTPRDTSDLKKKYQMAKNLVGTSARNLTELTYGVEEICGQDTRVQQSPLAWPWKTHCFIISWFGLTATQGTGFFIGPNAVMTAGHNLYNKDLGWATAITVFPARDGIFWWGGAWDGIKAWSVTGWTVDHDSRYDYGCVQLFPLAIGKLFGWLGYGNFSDQTLSTEDMVVSGYPGDKFEGTLWSEHGKFERLTEFEEYYMIDTYAGESGSPAWINSGIYINCTAGIHAYGGCPNHAIRINDGVFNNMVEWAKL